MDKQAEKDFVEGLAQHYITSDDSLYLKYIRQFAMRRCLKYIRKHAHALELGCEIGYMSSLISPHVDTLTTYDGSKTFIAEAKKKNLPNVNFVYALFEELSTIGAYEYAFASHVLEHLIDPQDVLFRVHRALKPSGILFIIVPNARAISRQLAHSMNIVPDLFGLTPNDIRGGHRRVYDFDSISKEVIKAGFEILEISGLLFKPFADFQVDELLLKGFLTKDHMEGLLALGNKYPDQCGAIFLAAQK